MIHDSPATIRGRLGSAGLLDLAERVAEETGVPLNAILAHDRHPRIVWARGRLYFALRCRRCSPGEIGALLDRDRGTILHAISPYASMFAEAIRPTTTGEQRRCA